MVPGTQSFRPTHQVGRRGKRQKPGALSTWTSITQSTINQSTGDKNIDLSKGLIANKTVFLRRFAIPHSNFI